VTRCKWCGLDHPRGGPSRTREWIACREALGNEIVRLTQENNDLRSTLEKVTEQLEKIPENS
jgi:hypothetical protein